MWLRQTGAGPSVPGEFRNGDRRKMNIMRAMTPWAGMGLFKDEMERMFDRFLEPRWGVLEAVGEGQASNVGLRPRVRASADRVRTGHISKEGNRLLRWVLVLAATQAVRRPGPLRTWFHAVKQRRRRHVARVAVARRLAEIVYHVLKQECDYFTVVRHGVVRG